MMQLDEELDPKTCWGVSYLDGAVYEGHWHNGMKEGFGVLTFKDGSVYMGNFVKGLSHGLGIHVFDQGYYKGEFSEGTYDGYGVYRVTGAALFEGRFAKGGIQGTGRLTLPDGVVDEGEWVGATLVKAATGDEADEAVIMAQTKMDQAIELAEHWLTPRTNKDRESRT